MKKIVGIFCDGLETKIAILEKRAGLISVIDITSYGVSLKERILKPSIEGDMLGSEIVIEADESELSAKNPLPVILKNYNLSDLVFIPTVTEPHVSYLLLPAAQKISDKALKSLMFDAWRSSHKTDLRIDNINYIKLDGQYLSIYTNEYFPVLTQLDILSSVTGKRNLKIPHITSADAILSEYILANYFLDPTKTYMIVYLGIDSTRMIFIQDKIIKHISSYLGVGVQTQGVHDILASRISLEMENAQIHDVDKVFLCGEVVESTMQLTFYGSFPLAEIEVINFDSLDTSPLDADKRNQLPIFTFPILSALTYIKPITKTSLSLNLLPKSVKEAQKVFKLGWIGILLLILLFCEVVFFTRKYSIDKYKLKALESDLITKQELLSENARLYGNLEQLNWRIEAGNKILQSLDTLIQGAERWSEILNKIEQFQPQNKKIWLTNIEASENQVNIQGIGVNRYIIPDFSDYLDNSTLKNIITQAIRDKDVNKFEINLDPQKYGYKGLEK